MWIRVCVGCLVVLGVGLAVPELALTRSSGAPAGFAGDIIENGEPRTCRTCHTGNVLNDALGGGSVTIDAPDSATPGETVTITVTMVNNTPASSSGRRQGFSATVKDPSTNTFVGSFTLPDPNTVQLADNNSGYVTHTFAGNALTTWTFQWTGPTSDVPSEVVIYTAVNAANGQGTSGDYIYTDTHTLSLTSVAAEEGPLGEIGMEWASVAPNPVRDVARAELVLAEPMAVTVRLVDGRGRFVRELTSGMRPTGTTRIDLDVHSLAIGTYFLVAETDAGRRTQAVHVVR